MSNDNVVSLATPAGVSDPLTELLRTGARRLIEAAVSAEFEEYLSAFGHEKLPDGRQRVVRNDTLRREMYVEMQRILHNEGASVVPAFNDQVMAATKKLQFTQPLRVHRMWDGYNGPERWWFA